jgi:hypothetical protein
VLGEIVVGGQNMFMPSSLENIDKMRMRMPSPSKIDPNFPTTRIRPTILTMRRLA